MEWALFFKKKKNQYEFNIEPKFPEVEDLIDHAEKITNSCFLQEQVNVGERYVKEIAIRGLMSRKYSLEDTKRINILLDHMVKRRLRQIYSVEY